MDIPSDHRPFGSSQDLLAGRPTDADAERRQLEQRVGPVPARMRLGLERDFEAAPRPPLNPLHLESFVAHPELIASVLRAVGLYGRGARNAAQVRLTRNTVALAALPAAFEGFTLLHMSDLHVDMSEGAMIRVAELLRGLRYDLCVLTGDYRGASFGPHAAAIAGMERLLPAITAPIFAVLGDHDSLRMVPPLEALGIRMLMNERTVIERGGARLHIAGIDDAHRYRADDIAGAAAGLDPGACAILLSHTPEVFRQAAHAGFQLMLSGHTHGGQICLPGRTALTLECVLPRRMGAGAWRYRGMQGYTSVGAGSSVVPVRFFCPPEITLHELRRSP